MISDKKRLEIANVCYANVAGDFAMFTNPKYRGENFSWERFPDMCERHAEGWMFIHGVSRSGAKNENEVKQTAKQYAKEIAQRLVDRMSE